jgi:glycosyltransferase involved in cell wall biosynthesis
MSRVRLYGRLLTQASQAVVTDGFRLALSECGKLAGVYGVDVEGVPGYNSPEGSDAKYGVYVGPLGRLGVMFEEGRHEYHFVMVTPNSDRLPPDLVVMLQGYLERGNVDLIAPSCWAARVVEAHFPTAGCSVVPHGLSPEYRPISAEAAHARAALYRHQPSLFRAVHFSTSDRERKGTIELIRAFAMARLPASAELLLVLDDPAREALTRYWLDHGEAVPARVKILPRGNFKPSVMAALLGQMHLVCQPSRGEGFGLIPLQALAVGTPVFATFCTGHSEYLRGRVSGVVEVPTGPVAPLDDLPGSSAPSLDVAALSNSLILAYHHWENLQAEARHHAPSWGETWSWSNQLRPFTEGDLK